MPKDTTSERGEGESVVIATNAAAATPAGPPRPENFQVLLRGLSSFAKVCFAAFASPVNLAPIGSRLNWTTVEP